MAQQTSDLFIEATKVLGDDGCYVVGVIWLLSCENDFPYLVSLKEKSHEKYK